MFLFFLYSSEIKKIESGARDHFQKIFNDHEKVKQQLEEQKRELELRGQELEQREVVNEHEQKKLFEELEQVQDLIHGCSVFYVKFMNAEVRLLLL